jgi:hypothetical protein
MGDTTNGANRGLRSEGSCRRPGAASGSAGASVFAAPSPVRRRPDLAPSDVGTKAASRAGCGVPNRADGGLMRREGPQTRPARSFLVDRRLSSSLRPPQAARGPATATPANDAANDLGEATGLTWASAHSRGPLQRCRRAATGAYGSLGRHRTRRPPRGRACPTKPQAYTTLSDEAQQPLSPAPSRRHPVRTAPRGWPRRGRRGAAEAGWARDEANTHAEGCPAYGAE